MAGWPEFPRIPENVKDALVDLRDRMRERFGDRFVEARLFGSYARGEQDDESDVDVLLLFATPLSMDEADAIFDDVAPIDVRHRVWLSPKAFAADAWAKMVARDQQLAAEIEKDGIRIDP